jgi:DNA-binding NarL/FixJ family response regulator
MDEITVLIADDFETFRQSLLTFFMAFDEIRLLGMATNGEEAVEMCAELSPQVILMDIDMPFMNGIQATRIIRKKFPQVQVIGLTGFDDTTLINEMRDAGAFECLDKTGSVLALRKTIHEAAKHTG